MHNKSVVSQNTAYKYNVGNKQKKNFLVKYITLDIKISLRLRLHDFWNVRGIIMVWFNHELYGFQWIQLAPPCFICYPYS